MSIKFNYFDNYVWRDALIFFVNNATNVASLKGHSAGV